MACQQSFVREMTLTVEHCLHFTMRMSSAVDVPPFIRMPLTGESPAIGGKSDFSAEALDCPSGARSAREGPVTVGAAREGPVTKQGEAAGGAG